MRQLSKRTLDELAEVMPTINDADQQKLVGGTFYYTILSSTEAIFIGHTGSVSDYGSVTPSTYNAYHNGQITFEQMAQTATISSSFSNSGNTALTQSLVTSLTNKELGATFTYADLGTLNSASGAFGYNDMVNEKEWWHAGVIGNEFLTNVFFAGVGNLQDVIAASVHELGHTSDLELADYFTDMDFPIDTIEHMPYEDIEVLREKRALDCEASELGGTSSSYLSGYTVRRNANTSQYNALLTKYGNTALTDKMTDFDSVWGWLEPERY